MKNLCKDGGECSRGARETMNAEKKEADCMRAERKKKHRILRLAAALLTGWAVAAFLCRAAKPTLLDVPYRSQLPDYPTGCETVSAAMLCSFYGIPFDTERFVEDFLPRAEEPHEEADGWVGGDMWESFLGDPRSEDGWGCYATALSPALTAYIEGSGYRAETVQGVELSTLAEKTVGAGIPVLLWVTIGMETPRETATWMVSATGESRTWIYPMHCAVLIGYDLGGYIFHDPLSGARVRYPKRRVEAAYDALYRQAVVLVPEG